MVCLLLASLLAQNGNQDEARTSGTGAQRAHKAVIQQIGPGIFQPGTRVGTLKGSHGGSGLEYSGLVLGHYTSRIPRPPGEDLGAKPLHGALSDFFFDFCFMLRFLQEKRPQNPT